MKNKGFTLIELLVTITIIAVISTIVVVSVSKISDSMKEANRKNIIKRIEAAASKYAYDTKKTKVYVDTLIKEGYYSLDGDYLLDPTDENNRLNCYLVTMSTPNGNYYNAKFDENGKHELSNKTCNESYLN